MTHTYHVAPFVPKLPVSIIALEWSSTEADALRSVLEYFWFQVDFHLIGSRAHFLRILEGEIPTQELVILCCHGDKKEGIQTCPDEEPLSSHDLQKIASLKNKVMISLGCFTGTEDMAKAYLQSGCKAYIAPTDAPFGNAALLFTIHLCYELQQNKKSLPEAFKSAQEYDEESGMFRLWER